MLCCIEGNLIIKQRVILWRLIWVAFVNELFTNFESFKS